MAMLADLLDLTSLQQTVASGAHILIAVSGGADSVALLRSLCAVQHEHQYRLSAIHVNHGLRPGADAEETFVKELCAKLQVQLYVRRLTLTAKPAQTSPEQYWRQQRYEQFAAVLQEAHCGYLALGHTADDLAETFLFHLARGTGVQGLTFRFYSENSGFPVIRPLWHTRRADIERTLRDIGQKWMSDPSNQDLRFSRNLIRHNVIPELEKINPETVDAIVNLAGNLKTILDAAHPSSREEVLSLNSSFSLKKDSDVSTVVDNLRNFVKRASGATMDRRQTAQASSIISSKGTGTVALGGNVTLVITQQFAWIYAGAHPSDLQLAMQHVKNFGGIFADLAGSRGLEGSRVPVGFSALDENYWHIELKAADTLQFYVRNRRAGDRIGSKLLARLFIDFKLPWYLRDYAVLLVDQDQQVLAVAGLDKLNRWIARHLNISNETVCTKSAGQA